MSSSSSFGTGKSAENFVIGRGKEAFEGISDQWHILQDADKQLLPLAPHEGYFLLLRTFAW